MTSQEKDLLERFLQQMTAAQAGPKDGEADALIRDAVARQPSAAYLLVQRALQLEQLLDAAEARAQQLQAELEQARSGSRSNSFLSDPVWGARPGAAAAQSSPAQPPAGQAIGMGTPLREGTAAAPAATPPAAAAPVAGARPGWGSSGMLGTVATTAAGVVAGSFLFQGIQGLMHRGDNNPASDQTGHHGADSKSSRLLDTPQDDLDAVANLPGDDSSDSSDLFADSGDSDYA